MYPAQIYARTHRVEDSTLDSYAAMGAVLSRDAAHVVVAALRRDAFDMRSRGGDANIDAAQTQEALAAAVSKALCPHPVS